MNLERVNKILDLFRTNKVNLERENKFQKDLEYGRYIQVNLDQKQLNIPEKLPSNYEICQAPARQTKLNFSQIQG